MPRARRQVFSRQPAAPTPARGDRLEFPAHFRRGIRLEVERVELAGTATEEDDQDGFRAAGPDCAVRRGPQDAGQPCSHNTGGAGLQESAAMNAESGLQHRKLRRVRVPLWTGNTTGVDLQCSNASGIGNACLMT